MDSFAPNVHDVHEHAYFFNICLTPEQVQQFQPYYQPPGNPPKLEIDVDSEGKAWLTLLFDQMTFISLFVNLLKKFIKVDSFTGPQLKVNLPVRDIATKEKKGYLLMQADFQSTLKALSVKSSQKIPGFNSKLDIPAPSDNSFQVKLQTLPSWLTPAEKVSCVLEGSFINEPLSEADKSFISFISRERKIKFLNESKKTITYCPVIATDEECKRYKVKPSGSDVENSKMIRLNDTHSVENLKLFLSKRLPDVDFSNLSMENLRCFYQPTYSHLDHVNRPL